MSEAYTSELEKQVQELKLLLKQRNDKIVELGGKIIELEGQSASLRERIKDHEIQAKQSEEDAEILRDLRSENARLTRENQTLKQTLDAKEANLAEAQPRMKKLQALIDDLRLELLKEMDRNKLMHQCVRRANECEALAKKWEVEIVAKNDEIEQLKNKVTEQKRQNLNERLANRRLQDDLDASGRLREQCDKLELENQEAKQSMEKLRKKSARQRSMLTDAHRMMHAFFDDSIKSKGSAASNSARSSRSDCDLGGVQRLRSQLSKAQQERLCALCVKRGDYVRANNGRFSFIARVRYVDRIMQRQQRGNDEQTSVVVGLRFVSLYPPKHAMSVLVSSKAYFASEADVWNTAGEMGSQDESFKGLCLGLAFPIMQIEAVHVDKSDQFIPLRRLSNAFLVATHNGTV